MFCLCLYEGPRNRLPKHYRFDKFLTKVFKNFEISDDLQFVDKNKLLADLNQNCPQNEPKGAKRNIFKIYLRYLQYQMITPKKSTAINFC